MKRWLLVGLAAAALPACTRHTVKIEPIEIKPIHITMDINVKVQTQLAEDFAFEDEFAATKEKKK